MKKIIKNEKSIQDKNMRSNKKVNSPTLRKHLCKQSNKNAHNNTTRNAGTKNSQNTSKLLSKTTQKHTTKNKLYFPTKSKTSSKTSQKHTTKNKLYFPTKSKTSSKTSQKHTTKNKRLSDLSKIDKSNPIIIINFKAYERALGKNAVRLAKICEQVSKEYNSLNHLDSSNSLKNYNNPKKYKNLKNYKNRSQNNSKNIIKVQIAIAPQTQDLYLTKKAVSIPILTQHFDLGGFGAHTGHDIIEGLMQSGACGSLLNHSEKPLPIKQIYESVERAKSLGFVTVVCADSIRELSRVVRSKPDYVAFEVPSLIGGKVSITSKHPKELIKGVNICKEFGVPLLCGAGVHSKRDVKKALELGCAGVLLASAVANAWADSKDPKSVLEELVKGAF